MALIAPKVIYYYGVETFQPTTVRALGPPVDIVKADGLASNQPVFIEDARGLLFLNTVWDYRASNNLNVSFSNRAW